MPCKFLGIMMHTWSCVWDVCVCREACRSTRSTVKPVKLQKWRLHGSGSWCNGFLCCVQVLRSLDHLHAVHGCPCLLQPNFAGIMFIVGVLDITTHKFCPSSSFFLLPVSTLNRVGTNVACLYQYY